MITVHLTDSEIMTCRFIGSLRTLNCRASDAQQKYPATPNDDITGVIGEYAFGKHYNLFMDITVHARKGGHDFIGRKKQTIDIKATTRLDGRLIAPVWKNETASDIYVLAIVNEELKHVLLIGYAAKDDFINDANITDLGRGPCYVLSREALKPLQESA